MIFKNKRGEVPWYVIALILAIIVLLVSLGAVRIIKNSQDQATGDQTNGCTILGGTCQEPECGTSAEKSIIGSTVCDSREPNCCITPTP